MHVLLSGSSGFIGSALLRRLHSAGHKLSILARPASTSSSDEFPVTPIPWYPLQPLDPQRFAGIDAVVHLAGKTVSSRWTDEIKRDILSSRVEPTRNLAESIAAAARSGNGPRVFISASATGYYGSRAGELLVESSPSGTGFLPEVCRQWEAASHIAANAGVRVVNPRIGIVLDPSGAALKKMLPIFRLGLAGPIGTGDQWWSWITLNDVVRLIEWTLTANVSGPVNAVSLQPVTNAEFTRTLARTLHRPAMFPVPAFAARLAMGAAADELILASAKVAPTVAEQNGFHFDDPDLPTALKKLLSGSTKYEGRSTR